MTGAERPTPAPGAAPSSWATRIVGAFLDSNFSVLLVLLFLGLGAAALIATPREEDPQIVVPFIDVLVELPGAAPEEVSLLAAEPLERLFFEIPGVEHVYSRSGQGEALVTVRFEVGQDRERALVNVETKLRANLDRVPPQVTRWQVKPVEIDDVPILTVTLHSTRRSGAELVRFADEIAARLQSVVDVSRVEVHGGPRRAVRVALDLARLSARGLTHDDVRVAIERDGLRLAAGVLTGGGLETDVEVGPPLERVEELGELVVAVRDGRPVLLADVADVAESPEEPTSYTHIGFGPAATALQQLDPVTADDIDGRLRDAVTIAISKRKGTNAVVVAAGALARFQELKREIAPDDVRAVVTRDHGATANEKVNELVGHLLIAVGTIVVLIGASLGWRAAFIVALAVPLTLAVTLFADLLVGFTINRVTLFALILSLGLLVDDPIVDVENIHRHLRRGLLPPREATLAAVDEVRPPVILATLAVIMSFLPLFFVGGMMGPYMRPMPFNVPVAMLVSLAVAFTITPWASYRVLRHESTYGRRLDAGDAPGDADEVEGFVVRSYRRIARYLLGSRARGALLLGVIGVLFVGSILMAVLGFVPLKMLPFDNKSELQVTVEAPEGTSLEATDRAVADLVRELLTIDEVTDVEAYVGHPSPHDFNGLVRHHFLRRESHQGDVRINLLPRHERGRQAHAIALDARPGLEAIAARHGVTIGIVEPPPGPPVLAGVVAEVYPPLGADPGRLAAVTRDVERRFRAQPMLRDVDTYLEAPRARLRFDVDRAEAALRGVAPAAVGRAVHLALSGLPVGALRTPGERLPLPIRLEVPRADRSTPSDLLGLQVASDGGELVLVDELVTAASIPAEVARYRKDMRDVQYVTGEAVGASPVDAVFALQDSFAREPLPDGFEIDLAGEGEWQVTVDVFIDLGIAFGAALAGIYVLLVAQTGSFLISALMMLAIPLTMIGVFPGFWLLNLIASEPVGDLANPIFFTATGMIGIIALAGIVVRNSIILVDFIEHNVARGMPLVEACIDAGAVRLRPILLTAGAAVMGAWVIVFDPIFSGLAWSFVFGVVASTLFSLLVIPIAYSLTRRPA